MSILGMVSVYMELKVVIKYSKGDFQELLCDFLPNTCEPHTKVNDSDYEQVLISQHECSNPIVNT